MPLSVPYLSMDGSSNYQSGPLRALRPSQVRPPRRSTKAIRLVTTPFNMARLQRLCMMAFPVMIAVSFIMAALPNPPDLPASPSDKTQHVVTFASLMIAGMFGFPRFPAWRLWLALVGFGALIELVQAIPVLHRDSDWIDLLVDAMAALGAWPVVLLIRRWLPPDGRVQRSK